MHIVRIASQLWVLIARSGEIIMTGTFGQCHDRARGA